MEEEALRLEIRGSPIHGEGVFAAATIRRGALVAAVTGEPKHYTSFPRDLLLTRGFEVAKDTYIVPDKESPAWYFNHSDTPNCKYSAGARNITALREITPGEELTIDYNETTTWAGYAELWKEGAPP